MLRSNTCIFVLAFVALAVAKAKPPPTPSPWASYGKPTPSPWASFGKSASPVSLGSLGPPFAPAMGSITVPYMPKSSPFFPKLVDPKSMIATKTGMLTNMFGGLGPVDYSVGAPGPFAQYPPGFARPVLYSTGADDETKGIKDFTGTENIVGQDKMKRGAFGPGGPVYGAPKASPFSPFSPFAAGFNPFASKFASASSGYPYPGISGPGFYSPDAASSRRRRSITDTEGGSSKALGPPPAYPGLAPISEEPESAQAKLLKLYDPAAAPKEMTPGMFGLFGPFGPYAAPAPVDPAAMAAKKTAFLDSLFKSLASTTPAATAVESEIAVTEIPVPKSTIVPPDFWIPSAIIPGPGEYTSKVATFLDKLFEHIANKTAATAAAAATTDVTGKPLLARSVSEDPAQAKILYARSIEDLKTIAAAKDAIVESILTELADLKTDMMSTLNDYILYVKTAPVAPGSKKPFKKPSPFAAFFAPPTPDTSLPFKQRMAALSEVFDMLTGLEKNITVAVQDVIKSATEVPIAQDSSEENVVANDGSYGPSMNYPAGSYNAYDYSMMAPIAAYNATLFDALKARLADLDQAAGTGFNKPIGAYYPAPVKRGVDPETYETPEDSESQQGNGEQQFKRAVQMQMHQGYQSMPPGTIESVQAGGGSVPGHQGGGIKLLEYPNYEQDWSKWAQWAEQFKTQNEGHGHHHNRH